MDASQKTNKAKTVATVDVNLQLNAKDWVRETVADYLHCVLCGGTLHFHHKTDFIEQVVAEEAHCPSCRVRTKQNTHRLQ